MEFRIDPTRALARMSPNVVRHVYKAIAKESRAWAIDEQDRFTEERLNGRPGLKRWTGQLARSLKPIWETSPGSTRAGFYFLPTMQTENGPIDNYAGLHEGDGSGGPVTVRPKNGRMLAWPVQGGPAVTEGGRNRYGNSPRNFPDKLFFFRSGSGKMFLARVVPGSKRKGAGPGLEFVYHLAPSVEIPARLGFRVFAGQALTRIMPRLDDAKFTALGQIGGA